MTSPTFTLLAGSAIALASVLISSSARAEDLAMTIRPSGLSQVAEATTAFFPREIPLPVSIEHTILDCPFTTDDTVATVNNVVAGVEWNDLSMRIVDGMLVIDASLDMNMSLHFSAVNFYACFGTIDCSTSLSATGVNFVAKIALMSGLDGNVTFANSDVIVDLAMTNIALDVQGCALGDLVETVSDFMSNWVLDQLQAPAERALSGILSEKIAGLNIVLPQEIEKNGYRLAPRLNQLEALDAEGLKILAEVGVVGPSGPVSGLKPQEVSAEPLPASFSDGGIAFAVTDSLVTRSLAEAHAAGLFNSALSDAIPEISLSQEGLAQKLGLPAGTTVNVGLSLNEAPTVAFGRGGNSRAQIALPSFNIDVTVRSPDAAEGHLSITAGASLAVGFSIKGGALMVDVEDLVLSHLEIAAGSQDALVPDPVRIQKFVRDVAVPMLSAKLSHLPLAPAMQPAEGAFIWMRGLESEGGWLRMGVDLVVADAQDVLAPETSLPVVRLVQAGLASVPVSGTDDVSPRELLRYSAWLDGELLGEGPAFAKVIRFSAAQGPHVLEVAAVDLSGNMDSTPSRREIYVDGTPPTLTVDVDPEAIVQGDVVRASWRASDDQGTATTRWEIRVAASNGSVREVVASGEANEAGEIEVASLSHAEIYVLALIAEDEAGNVTSEEFGFAFEQGGGCSSGGSTGGFWLLALAWMAGALLRRRRLGAVSDC